MSTFYSIAFIVNLMMRHETQAWCDMTLIGTGKQQKLVAEIKDVLFMQYYIDKNWSLSRIIFKICFSRSCSTSRATKQTYFDILLPHRHILVTQNRRASVRLHHRSTSMNLAVAILLHLQPLFSSCFFPQDKVNLQTHCRVSFLAR